MAATGADRTWPAIEGIRALLGAGVYLTLPPELPETLRGRDAVVYGSHAGVVAGALRLGDICGRVTVVTPAAATALRGRGNVSILRGAAIVCVAGVDRLESVLLRHGDAGRFSAVEAAALFLIDAASPRTSWLPSAVARDTGGFVITGAMRAFETSAPRLYAAGDVRSGSAGGTSVISDAIRIIHVIRQADAQPAPPSS